MRDIMQKILRAFLAAAFLTITLHAQDIESGTGVIIAPPKNPIVRRRAAAARSAQQSRPALPKTPDAKPNNPVARAENTTVVNDVPEATTVVPTENQVAEVQPTPSAADQVEEALEQGNVARDANPPRYGEAERAYQKAAALGATDARPRAGLGNVYYDQRQYAEAETNFRRAVELDAKDADSYRYLAFTLIKLKKFKEAEQFAQRAVELDAQNFYGYSALGWAQFRLKNYAAAETAYQKAIALSPQTFGLYSDLGLFLAQQGRYQEAAEPYRKALALNATYAPALANYGVVMHKLWKLDEAEKAFVGFLQANKQAGTKAAPVESNLALVYYHRGDAAQARAHWEAAARLGSTSPLDRAGQLIVNKQYVEARALLEAYVRGNPGDENGWLLLGDAVAARGDQKLARKAYDNAARVAPLARNVARPKV